MTRIPEDYEPDYKEYDLHDAKDMGWRVRKVQKMRIADGHDAAKNYVSGLLGPVEETPMGSIVVTDEALDNIVEDRNAALEQYISHILLTLYDPDEVWRVCDTGQTGQREYREKYLKAFTVDETEIGFVASVRKGPEGDILLTVSKCERWEDIDSQRRGALLYSIDVPDQGTETHKMEIADEPDEHENQPLDVPEELAAFHITLTLREPDEVWLVVPPNIPPGRGEYWEQKYVKAFSNPVTGKGFSVGFVAIVREEPGGNILRDAFKFEQVEDIDNQRQGILIYAANM